MLIVRKILIHNRDKGNRASKPKRKDKGANVCKWPASKEARIINVSVRVQILNYENGNRVGAARGANEIRPSCSTRLKRQFKTLQPSLVSSDFFFIFFFPRSQSYQLCIQSLSVTGYERRVTMIVVERQGSSLRREKRVNSKTRYRTPSMKINPGHRVAIFASIILPLNASSTL